MIGRPGTVWYSTLTVDHGSSAGIQVNDAVVTGDGLVGRVRETTSGTAVVELITDHESAVSAEVQPDGPQGIVEPEVGDPDDLLLDFIEGDDAVQEGEMLLTAGWSNGEVSSAYPPGIPLGEVSQTETGALDATPDRPRPPVRRPPRARVRPGADRRARSARGWPDDRHPPDRDPAGARRRPRRDPPGLVLLPADDPRRGPEPDRRRRRLARPARRRRRRRRLRLRDRVPASTRCCCRRSASPRSCCSRSGSSPAATARASRSPRSGGRRCSPAASPCSASPGSPPSS